MSAAVRVVLRWLPVACCVLLVGSYAFRGNGAAAFGWGVAGAFCALSILWEGLVREQSRLIADQSRLLALRGVRR